MSKEPYVKPELTSETLEPGALCQFGSGLNMTFLQAFVNPSCGFCCDE